MLRRSVEFGQIGAGGRASARMISSVPTTILPAPTKECAGWSSFEDPTRKKVLVGEKEGSAYYTFEPAGEPKTALPQATRGPSPLVVCVHGAPGSTFDFRYFGPSVTGKRAAPDSSEAGGSGKRPPPSKLHENCPFLPVVRMDLPGHGQSDRSIVSSATGPSMAEGFLTTLEAIGRVEPAVREAVSQHGIVIAAHSLGAELALHAAAEVIRRQTSKQHSHSSPSSSAPSFAPRLRGLLLVNPVGLRPHKALRPFWLAQLMGRALELPSPVGDWMLELLYWFWIRVFGFPPRTLRSEIEWGQKRVSARDFALLQRDVELIARYSPVVNVDSAGGEHVGAVPTVVACAEDDHLVEPAVPEELASALKAVRVLKAKGGGHYLNKHGADATAGAITIDLGPHWR